MGKHESPMVLGTIFLTERYFVVGIGLDQTEDNRLVTIIDFDDRDGSKDFSLDNKLAGDSRAQFESSYRAALNSLIKLSEEYASRKKLGGARLDAVCIGSCMALKSTVSEERFWGDKSNYGVIAVNTRKPHWARVNLYKIACFELDGVVPADNITVRADSSLAALGEYHWRLARNKLISPQNLTRIKRQSSTHQEVLRRAGTDGNATLAYIKLSSEINAGVAFKGDLLGGTNHPFVSLLRPRRLEKILKGVVYRDMFEGTCELHKDCYTGLISSGALEARLTEINDQLGDGDVRYPNFHSLPPGHPVVYHLAFYTAQLCITMVATHVPSLIVLGGRILNDRTLRSEEKIEKGIVSRVNNEIKRQLRLDREVNGRKVEIPHFPDLYRPDGFVQGSLCNLPGVYGGLVLARRKYRNAQNGGVQNLFKDQSG
jgi:hypothetical protein